jgi:hypothetical protein
LASFFVEFTQKGLEGLQAGIKSLQDNFSKLENGVKLVGPAMTAVFSKAASSLEGFVRSGLSASATGQALNFHMQQLSLTIAGLFGPELRKLVDLVGSVTQYLRELSDGKKELIASFIKGAAAAMLVATVLPKIVGATSTVIAGVKALSLAFTGLGIASGGILPVFGVIATGLAALGGGLLVAENGFGGLLEKFKPFIEQLQGIGERLAPSFAAIADAGIPVFQAILELVAALADLFAKVIETILPLVGIFADVMPTAIGVLTDAVNLLGDALDSNIGKWALLTAGIYAAVAAIPAAVAGIWSMIVATYAYIKALVIQLAMQGPAGWAILAGAAVIAAGAVAAVAATQDRQNEKGKQAMGRMRDGANARNNNRSTLAPQIGGSESVTSMYDRIAALTIQNTAGRRSHEDEVEDRLRRIDENTSGITPAVRNVRPAVA